MVSLRPGMMRDRDDIIRQLVDIQYVRNDINFIRGTFRVRGDVLEIFPASESENSIRVEFFGDEIDRISMMDALTGKIIGTMDHAAIFPASHFATTEKKIERAIGTIKLELQHQLKELSNQNKLVEAQRLEQRTKYDLEMMAEMGFCSGIENYSRHLSGREPGSRPYTLIDYFPKDFLLMIDESHVTIPQIRGMSAGDKARKETLVEYGFRLPSALDNRPLFFPEFESLVNQILYISATPGPYEKEKEEQLVEQLIRPTGLLDPLIEIRPTKYQIDDLLDEIQNNVREKERVLITTLTKKMAEDLTKYLEDKGIKVTYLHSDIDTIERMEIIRDLRMGKYDVLVGINLLREGLDLPEVSLIAILDADKEGFLRSETSLIQTVGRAARNANGRVIFYADEMTKSMELTMKETSRRRKIQEEYNKKHHIVPKTIEKEIRNIVRVTHVAEKSSKEELSYFEIKDILVNMESVMRIAAESLDFERAAILRDEIRKIRKDYGLEEEF